MVVREGMFDEHPPFSLEAVAAIVEDLILARSLTTP